MLSYKQVHPSMRLAWWAIHVTAAIPVVIVWTITLHYLFELMR